jgi:hypothetical protein
MGTETEFYSDDGGSDSDDFGGIYGDDQDDSEDSESVESDEDDVEDNIDDRRGNKKKKRKEIENDDEEDEEAEEPKRRREKKEDKKTAKANTGDKKEGDRSDKTGRKDGDEKADEDDTESEKKGQSKETAKAKRTREETAELASEFYGVPKEEIVIDKDGNVKMIMKINGQKRLVSPDDIRKGFNLNQAGYEKLNEGKRIMAGFKNFFENAKANPKMIWELADRIGVDKHALAYELVEEKARMAEMSDEERLYHEEKSKREEQERELQELRAEKAKTALESEKRVHMQRLSAEMSAAMKKHGFDSTNKNVKKDIMSSAATMMMLANRQGSKLNADDAIYLAKQRWQDSVLSLVDGLDDDHIINVLPDRVIKAIRKADLKRLKSSSTPAKDLEFDQYIPNKRGDGDRPRRKERQTVSDYFENLI